MSDPSEEQPIITLLLQRMETQRLPHTLAIKARVDKGERLYDSDILFLQEVFADAERIAPLLDRHPEYQDIATRLVSLYKEITDKALANES